jgi:hypothetical protein
VALSGAFAVVAALDAGAPVWLVVGTGVAIGVAGHYSLTLVPASPSRPDQCIAAQHSHVTATAPVSCSLATARTGAGGRAGTPGTATTTSRPSRSCASTTEACSGHPVVSDLLPLEAAVTRSAPIRRSALR